MAETAEEAKVARVESTTRIVINCGKENGVSEGDRYLIYAIGPTVTDPDTGDNLGNLEVVKGRGRVVHVMDKMATLETESKTVTVRRQTIPSPLMRTYNLLSPQEIETETVPGEEFYDVKRGDLARRID